MGSRIWVTPGSDAANTARWAALTPEQRAADQAYVDRQKQITDDRTSRGRRFGNLVKYGVLGTVGAGAGAGALGAVGAGGAAGGGAGVLEAANLGKTAAGGGMNLGKLWDIGNLGVQGLSSFFGQRSNNRALDQQIALQRQQMALQQAADAEARAEQKRQFDATQANETRRFAADDEERAYHRRLLDEREARLAPYRAHADRSRQRLAQFLGLG